MPPASTDTANPAERSLFRLTCIPFLIIIITLAAGPGFSQKTKDTGEPTDSIVTKKHSPGKAALFSAILPGLGQVYNKKYWKIPVVYAGFGVLTYFLVTNTNNYMDYQCAYIEEVNGNTNGNYADLVNRYTEDQLLSAREYYRRNLEISILLTGLWYTLTILDASVDAHLMTFDVSQDLSMKVGPAVIPLSGSPEPGAGIRITFKF